MSKDWVKDIHVMQAKYLTRQWVETNPDKLKEFLEFRVDFLKEEFRVLIYCIISYLREF